MFCLRKLRKFGVQTEILQLFYNSVIMGVWRYCLICWGGNAKKVDVDRINEIIKKAGRVVGVCFAPVDSVYQELLDRKLKQVWEDDKHPLHSVLLGQGNASGRLRLPPLSTNRHRDSFIPRAIKLFNQS